MKRGSKLTPEQRAARGNRRLTVEQRFFAKVRKDGPVFKDRGPCWLWTGSVWHSYGNFFWNRKVHQAHRVSWVLAGRELPVKPLVLDHECRDQTCVNPDHLRVVTETVNALENNDSPFAKNARRTHCKHGHLLSGPNVIQGAGKGKKGRPTRNRVCITCYLTRRPNAKVICGVPVHALGKGACK